MAVSALMLAGYLFGVVGRINQPCIGYVEEPDIDAFHYVDGPKQPTYRVTFRQKDLWEGYQVSHPPPAYQDIRISSGRANEMWLAWAFFQQFLCAKEAEGGTRVDNCCLLTQALL